MSTPFPFEIGTNVLFQGPVWHYVGTLTEIAEDHRWFKLSPAVYIESSPLTGNLDPTKHKYFTAKELVVKIPRPGEIGIWDCRVYEGEIPTESWTGAK